MEAVQLKTCQRCRERRFEMDLKEGVCHRCYLRDTDNRKRPLRPFLMSAENQMDPGIVLAHLLELTQIEEMVVARAYVTLPLPTLRIHLLLLCEYTLPLLTL